MQPILKTSLKVASCLVALASPLLGQSENPDKPNILWIMLEDWCPDLSCYGSTELNTPNIDALAESGTRYTHAYTTSPVCSTSRSAMMTGFHQNYIGANQHRTSKKDKKPLPYGIKPVPHLLEDVGYYTCLLDHKTDCNFTTEKPLFQGKGKKALDQCKPGQPYFAQITFHGTHRPWRRDAENPIDEKDVTLPPYYPNIPIMRRDWANGLEEAQVTDREVGEFLKQLKEKGFLKNTVIFLIGDHGRCMPRGKQFLYEEGTHIPLIFNWPGKVKANAVNDDLVMSIDISKTILDIAGAKSAHPLHGKNLLSKEIKNRQYVFAARDKMDNTHDSIRSIRSKKMRYNLNLMPERPYLQYNWYKEALYPSLAILNAEYLNGHLNKDQLPFMADHKPAEELYDLEKDPFELHNVANDPAYADAKARLKKELADWRKSIHDKDPSDEFRKGGWPATYPTKSKEEWNAVMQAWKPYLYRKPTEKPKRSKELIELINKTDVTKKNKTSK